MATIPLQVASRSLDTGGVVQYPQGGEIGRAVQDAGSEFSEVAARVQERQDQMDKFKRMTLEDQMDQDVANRSAELARDGAADGAGLHDSIVGQVGEHGQVIKPGLFDDIAKSYRAQMPQSQVGFFEAGLPAKRMALSGRAASAQYEQEQKYATVEVGKIQNGVIADILRLNDPAGDKAGFEALKAKGRQAILNAPLGALAKQSMLNDWDQSSPKALAQAISAQNPGKLRELFGMSPVSADGGNAVDDVTDRIIGVESSGNANAKNPRSSASGIGQFLDSTWVQTVRQHRPDIAAGKSAAQIISLKGDKALGREMVKAYQQDNADYLTNRGLPTTRGNIYLAHFLGPAGATEVLKADPNTPVVNVVGQDVVNANPFLKGMTAAETAAWAEKKMGGARTGSSAPDARFAGMSPDDMISLANNDDVALRQKQAADIAQAKIDYTAKKDHIELGIRTGEIRDPALVLNSGLNEGDQASLYEMLKQENKDNAGVDAIIGAIAKDQKVSVNPFNSDVTKVADKAYDLFMKSVPDDQRLRAASTYVTHTGYIPDTLQAELRQGAAAKTAPELSVALSNADTLERMAPVAFSTIPGTDVQTKLTDYRHYVNDLGMTGDAAAQQIIDHAQPTTKQVREELKPQADKFLKNLTVGDVTNAFDTFTGPGGEPGAGAMPQEPAALLAEYKGLAEDAYYDTAGNADLAKARALQAIKKNWGISNISGTANLMRLPPENQYPPIGGNFDYLRADALKTAQDYVAAQHPDRKVENVAIRVSDKWTRRDIEMKRPARYELYYQYEDHGQPVWDQAFGVPWGVSAEEIDQVREKEVGRKMISEAEAARKDGDILRQAQTQATQIATDPDPKEDFIRALEVESTLGAARMNVENRKDERAKAAEPAPPEEQADRARGTRSFDGSQPTGFGNIPPNLPRK
jgi:hypothetical protein